MEYEQRTGLTAGGRTYFNGTYEKPMICPYCGVYTDATQNEAHLFTIFNSTSMLVVSNKCTRCKKNFFAAYVAENGKLTLNAIIPIIENDAIHEGLAQMSPDFERIHQQAFRSETRGDLDVAAAGYRTALEFLIKDYAIKELNMPEDEVSKKTLSDAIKEYANDADATVAFDVSRVLGNDYVHYKRKNQECGFETFKHYYKIALQLMGIKYDVKHPPIRIQRSI